ncbi:uncharacterized protein MJAP1_002577 [Malassezia japonica]|uniref:Ribosomal protein/NADH dehydrogenase domain-containing protein n=1 Tax=Malassezia japonica TaxID=223818 RepID=A0AAF0JAA4_9BASI|nr:uncharacterized protein MJAP1_002577 [Malassezia japonica]WFD39597.1 hypothetical protein MJAP1_002577 [Malassezia japonica]
MSSVLSKAFPAVVKEIRLHLSPTGTGSAGARKFLETNYKTIKQNNPNLPFLVREAEKTPARLIMRMERGAERDVDINALEPRAIEKKIAELLK